MQVGKPMRVIVVEPLELPIGKSERLARDSEVKVAVETDRDPATVPTVNGNS